MTRRRPTAPGWHPFKKNHEYQWIVQLCPKFSETETIRLEGTRDDPTLSRSSDHVLELKVLRFRENKGTAEIAQENKSVHTV
jgi:hypothetical protein